MAVSDLGTEKEYHDFKCQFDANYATSVVEGHKEWMEKRLISEIGKAFKESKPYKILSVGSGTGYPDQGLLELLAKIAKEEGLEKRKIVYTVSEPDPKAVEVCKGNLEAATKGLDFEFKFDVAPSEKYIEALEEEFDLIHFVHVLSWLKDPESILAKCYYKLLTKDGLIAVVEFNKEYMGGECHCEGEECAKEGMEGTQGSKDERDSDGAEEKEQGGLMCVEVDVIAKKYGWNCKKFANDLKIDLSEASKPTDAGRAVAFVWMHADPSSMNDEEKEKNRTDLVASLTKEEINGDIKYFYALNEMIYFLTKG